MKILKKNINDQVRNLNSDVYRVRENEFLIECKEKILKNMENAINEIKYNDFDKLLNIFKQYKELDFEYRSPLINQHVSYLKYSIKSKSKF